MATPVIDSFSPASGAVGSTVVITGSNFDTPTATVVLIGGAAAASFTVDDDATITAVVGDGADVGAVVVTNASGTATTEGVFVTAANPFPVSPFGQSVYGEPWSGNILSTTVDIGDSNLDVGALTVSPLLYGHSLVAWSTPTETHDRIVLVRSQLGYPITTTDGVVLIDVHPSALIEQRQYDHGLALGRWVYYSLFIRVAVGSWKRVGIARTMIPNEYKSSEMLEELLPPFYLQFDEFKPASYGKTTGDTELDALGSLARFLRLLGYEIDLWRTTAASLFDLWKPDALLYESVAASATTFGFPVEPHLGAKAQRRLMANWGMLQRLKGTSRGVELFVSSFTGWASVAIDIGWNELLSDADAQLSAIDPANDGSTSNYWRWTASNSADLDRNASPPGGAPVSNVGTIAALEIEMTTTGAVALSLGSITNKHTVRNTCVPVSAGEYYALSAYVRAHSTTRSVTPKIDWYAFNGTIVSTTTGSAVTESSSAWSRITAVGAAPDGAAYARIGIGYSNGAGAEKHYVTAVQLETVNAPTLYNKDDFNRAGPAAGDTNGSGTGDPAAWAFTGSDWTIASSTKFASPATASLGYLPDPDEGDDYRVECALVTVGSTGIEVCARVSHAAPSYYSLRTLATGVVLMSVVAGDATVIDIDTSVTPVAGDTLAIEVRGSSITGFVITADGAVTQLGPVIDGRVTTASPDGGGIRNLGSGWEIDNFIVRPATGRPFPSSAGVYEPSRRIEVRMEPERENICRNPSFETNTNFWAADSGCTIARSTALSLFGGASLEVTATGSAVPMVTTRILGKFSPGFYYTASAYVRQASSGADPDMKAYIKFFWYSDEAMTSILGSSVGIVQLTVPSTGWITTPISAAAKAPAAAVAMGVTIVLLSAGSASPASGKKCYIDGVIVERNGVVGSYFDGSIDGNGDFVWDGEAHNSASMWYPGKTIKHARLLEAVDDFVPAYRQFRLTYQTIEGL